MYFFGVLSIIISLMFGGSAAYMFISSKEIDYFTLNGNINVGIFFAILGIGFLVINKLNEIKKELIETRKELPENDYIERLTSDIRDELKKFNKQESKKKTVEKITKELKIEPEKPIKAFDVAPVPKNEPSEAVREFSEHISSAEKKKEKDSVWSVVLPLILVTFLVLIVIATLGSVF